MTKNPPFKGAVKIRRGRSCQCWRSIALESARARSYSFRMIDTADTYLYRIEKKIDKLTSRLFMVSPQDRVELTSRIEKLKQRRKDYQLNKARIRVPEQLARQSRRMNAPCPR